MRSAVDQAAPTPSPVPVHLLGDAVVIVVLGIPPIGAEVHLGGRPGAQLRLVTTSLKDANKRKIL